MSERERENGRERVGKGRERESKRESGRERVRERERVGKGREKVGERVRESGKRERE